MSKCLICDKTIKNNDLTYSIKDLFLFIDGKCHKECGDKNLNQTISCYEEIKDEIFK